MMRKEKTRRTPITLNGTGDRPYDLKLFDHLFRGRSRVPRFCLAYSFLPKLLGQGTMPAQSRLTCCNIFRETASMEAEIDCSSEPLLSTPRLNKVGGAEPSI